MKAFATGVAALSLLAACGDKNSLSNVIVPGTAPTAKTKVLELGSALLQGKQPIEALNVYMDGFHFYSGYMKGQMEAHHFCSVLNEEVSQCVIFDGNGRDAKIMGVEYIVSRKLFDTLPPDEKTLWHSHVHEVKSGLLIAPGIPEKAEHEFMEKMVGTYGKTWHTWHTDKKLALPLGHPMLMMGFTADGQVDKAMVAGRDERFRVSTDQNRKDRESIPAPPVAPGADAWQQGAAMQVVLMPLAPSSAYAPAGHAAPRPRAGR